MNDVAIRRLQRALSSGWSDGPPVRRIASAVTGPRTGCTLSLDVDGTIVWAGPATREVLGWSPEDLAGSHVSVLTPRLVGDLDEAHLDLLLGADDAATLIDVGVKRDGRTFKASISLEAERSAAGEVTGLTAVVRDVTADLSARRSWHLARRTQEAVVIIDADLTIQYATPAVAEMLGYEPEDPGARRGARLIHPADHPAVTEAVDRLLADPGRVERLVARLRGRHERWLWVEATLSNGLADPDVRGLVGNLRDITDQVRTQDALLLSGALHQAMVETAAEGIVVAGEDGTTRYANPAMASLLGIPAEQLYGADPLALLEPGGPERAAGTPSQSAGGVWREEVVYAHPEGFDRILAVTRSPLSRDEAAGLGSLLMVADVTESRRSERALRRRALYDPLTGLPNRYLVRDRLEMAAARQARSDGGGTAVLFLDLDGFKPINDTHGHDAGDELLREVAGRLSGAVRATDTVGRHGGDEFVIICEEIDETDATSVARRVHAALRRPFQLRCGPVEIGASIGMALSPPYAVSDLVQQADVAMYRAKRDSGGLAVARP
jgi:diguanylate cyclase (GGDEF)-like protein/PAS domain S-box-containing protein